jgi:uncharacterized protein (DUF927 family)
MREVIKAFQDKFFATYVPKGAGGQVQRVAKRFGLFAAAGELARYYGVLPWSEDAAIIAAGTCFEAWLGERGNLGAGEDVAALAQVRDFIIQNGSSRFEPILPEMPEGDPSPELSRLTYKRAGWRRQGAGGDEYLIPPEIWKNQVCKGIDSKIASKVLEARGLLLGGDKDHRAASVRIPGVKEKVRVYIVSSAIVDDGGERDGSANGGGTHVTC